MIDLKTLTLKEKIKLFKDLYKEISSKGINGDTELAHINPFEARLLKMYGGSGSINEETGLEQYFGGGGGGGTTTSTSQTVAEPYGPSTGNLNQILSEAQNIYGRGPSGYVPQSALTLEGLAAQESLARQANTQISDTVAGKYSNPFLSPIIAQAAQDVYTGVNEAYSGVGRTASSPVAQSQVAKSVAQTALPAIRPSGLNYNLKLKLDAQDVAVPLASRPDALIAKHFEAALPGIKAQAFTSAAVKATASYLINKSSEEAANRQNAGSGAVLWSIATKVGTAIYTVGTTKADLRNWSTLPARFSVARLEAKPGQKLTVVGHPEASLTLPAGKVLLVSLKSTLENQPIVLRCTPLVP